MGIAQSMNKNMRKNMQQQMRFQKQLILKQRQLQLATQISLGRERFWYYSTFCCVAAIGLTAAALAKKDPRVVFPLVPLGFAYAFQYDMLYGNMMERAMAGADQLLVEYPMKFVLPAHAGIVSTEEYLMIMGIKDGKKQLMAPLVKGGLLVIGEVNIIAIFNRNHSVVSHGVGWVKRMRKRINDRRVIINFPLLGGPLLIVQISEEAFHLLEGQILVYKHGFTLNVESDSKHIQGEYEGLISNYRLMLVKGKVKRQSGGRQRLVCNQIPISVPIGYMSEIDIIKKEIIIKLKTGIILKLRPNLSQINILYQAILKGYMNLPFYAENQSPKQQSLSYDCLAELQRMRINYNFTILVENHKGRLCGSYPKYFVIPKKIQQNLLQQCLKIRNNNRVPTVSYYSSQYKTTLWRAAKLKTNQQNNKFNQAYMREISRDPLVIEMRQDQLGRQRQQSKSISLTYKFMSIVSVNILFKKVVISYAKNQNLMKVIQKWYEDIYNLLHCSYLAVEHLKAGKQVVLVQNYGYDRVSQVSALAQLIIDPYYRTINGFNNLIQKQFVCFGHPFGLRLGFQRQKMQEESPIFVQFLQSVTQLMNTHPDCFQFSVHYLARIAYEAYTTKYNNFYSESNSIKSQPKLRTPNIWKCLPMKKEYYNYQWSEKAAWKELIKVRRKVPSVKEFLVWKQYYDMITQMRCQQPNQIRVKHRRSSLYKLIHQKTIKKNT